LELSFKDYALFGLMEGSKAEALSLVILNTRTLAYEKLFDVQSENISYKILDIIGNRIIFTAFNASSKTLELWSSDGTLQTTTRIKSITDASADFFEFRNKLGNALILTADGGREVWKTDGTADGTLLIVDLSKQDPLGLGQANRSVSIADDAASDGSFFLLVDANYYDAASDKTITVQEVWRSDGTAAGTQFLKGFQFGDSEYVQRSSMIAVKDRILMILQVKNATDPGSRAELWSVTKASNEVTNVLSLNSGYINYLSQSEDARVPDTVYFEVNTSASATLYISDGSPQGTVPLREFGSIWYAEALGGTLLFGASESGSKDPNVMWKSDGTPQGTVPLFSGAKPPLVRDPGDCQVTNEKLICDAVDGIIWQFNKDGSGIVSRGYSWLEDEGVNEGSDAEMLGSHLGKFLLTAYSPQQDGLFVTGETPSSLDYLLATVPDRPFYGDYGPLFTVVGTDLYFQSIGFPSSGESIFGTTFVGTFYRTDLTSKGTVTLGTFGAGGIEMPYTSVGRAGNRFVFAGRDLTGWALFSADRSVSGLTRLDIRPGLSQHIASIGDLGLVQADGGFWLTDGTVAGTRLTDIPNFNLEDYASLNGTLYSVADDDDENGHSRIGLWRTDGTGAGTSLIKDLEIEGWYYDRTFGNMTTFNSKILFFAGAYPHTLWSSDGTSEGTVVLGEWNTLASDSNFITAHMDKAYIGVQGGSGKYFELWVTDGTPSGTSLLKKWEYEKQADYRRSPEHLAGKGVIMDGKLYLTAWNMEAQSYEIWRSDGTAAGTKRVVGTSEEAFLKIRRDLASNGLTIAFSASDLHVGMEVWALTSKDIQDQCPSDPRKIEPQVCGCGKVETDADADGIVDCGKRPPLFSPTPTPTPNPTGTPGPLGEPPVLGISVTAPILKQVKSAVSVSMQVINGVTYKITYTALPPKFKGKKKPKAVTITSPTPETLLKSFKVGTSVSVTYKIVRGNQESQASPVKRIKIRPLRKR